MIYFVSLQKQLFPEEEFVFISPEESLNMMQSWKVIQCDTETSGKLKGL